MKLLLSGVFCALCALPIVSHAQSCAPGQIYDDCSGPQFGPGGCVPGCRGEVIITPGHFGPGELCFPESCSPVTYFWVGAKAVAESRLPNGYEVMGWSGPCLNDDRALCPDILNQAFSDLRMNALRANRAQHFNSVE
jgi:hypothetical protein